MTRFEKWFMTRIIRKEVRQGFDHRGNITEMYKMIRVEAEHEFNEDNTITLNSFLKEMFEHSLRNPTK